MHNRTKTLTVARKVRICSRNPGTTCPEPAGKGHFRARKAPKTPENGRFLSETVQIPTLLRARSGPAAATSTGPASTPAARSGRPLSPASAPERGHDRAAVTDERGSRLPPPRCEVVVLGGGLAGLAAAVTLARAGADVQLFEARGRVGGRVMTLRAPFDDGLFAESGAEFISPGHRLLRRFLRRYGQRVCARPAAARLYRFGGCVWRGCSLADYGGRVKRDFELIERRSLALGAGVPDPARPWAAPAAAE